jgi:type I site-specific restriction endonuclease
MLEQLRSEGWRLSGEAPGNSPARGNATGWCSLKPAHGEDEQLSDYFLWISTNKMLAVWHTHTIEASLKKSAYKFELQYP